jgi:mRNA interferase ChpB
MRTPSAGEIWFVNLNPAVGREQQGTRPVLVVSDNASNTLGLCVICPITQGGQQFRNSGFAVPLMGTKSEAQGVVMCNHPRAIDIATRQGRYAEKLGQDLLDEVYARMLPIFGVNNSN